MTDFIIETEHLHRTYHVGSSTVHAVQDVSIQVPTGALTAVVGRSGAGKTTLLNLMSGLDTPDEGRVIFDGEDMSTMTGPQKLALRREKVGFVFQNFGLLPLLTAQENVEVPLRMMRFSRSERQQRVREALDWVGLSKRLRHRPYELSGGEQQRVAIARALVARPKIILADEPTGQLDSRTGEVVLETMRRLSETFGITLLIVTHDDTVMRAADLIYELRDGKLIDKRVGAAAHT